VQEKTQQLRFEQIVLPHLDAVRRSGPLADPQWPRCGKCGRGPHQW